MNDMECNGQSVAYLTAAAKTGSKSIWTSLWSDWGSLYQSWQQNRRHRADMKHVATFSSHMLKDIGMTTVDVANRQPKSHFACTDTVGRPG